MIRFSWFASPNASPSRPLPQQGQLRWTLANLLMLSGVVLLLYVGGVYANEEYGRYAARGDSDAPAPVAVAPRQAAAEPAPFVAPNLNSSNEGLVTSQPPSATRANHESTITRVIIPSITVDSKVVEVGWDVVQQNGAETAVWQVAEYAVGQHRGSANPGEGDNIVLAGHVGGYGKVFKDLYYVQPGDRITIYSAGEQHLYIVQERLVVREEGVSDEQHAANAKYIEPGGQEMLTMVTCWPPKGADRFTERVIVRALPFAAQTGNGTNAMSSWSIR